MNPKPIVQMCTCQGILPISSLASQLFQRRQYRHQEFQSPLWYAVHLGKESEHKVLNESHIFVSFTPILLLFGTKFQYSLKWRQNDNGKNPIRLPWETSCPLTGQQCLASNNGNWKSWCLYINCDLSSCNDKYSRKRTKILYNNNWIHWLVSLTANKGCITGSQFTFLTPQE